MLRSMPPLEAAEAFLAAARERSFRAAAATLALSPSAFSRRVQQLERFVGVDLFVRSSSRSELSAAGRAYLAEVADAVETIRLATSTLRDRYLERTVRIGTSHSLAAEWLMPRVPRLLEQHGITATITVSRNPQALRDGSIDLGIWGGDASGEDVVSTPIAAMSAIPVSTSRLADGRPPPRSLREIGAYRLLADRTSRKVWPRWLAAAGFEGRRPPIDDGFETNQLCNEAAASGLGIALCLPMVSERFVATGRLQACFPTRCEIGVSYQVHTLVHPSPRSPVHRVVAEWLKREAETSTRDFDTWCSTANSSHLLLSSGDFCQPSR